MHKQNLLVLLIVLLFTSCSHVYTPALYHSDIVYQPKPASFDSVKSVTYVSAGLGANTSIDGEDFLTRGEIDISRGHVFNGFNLSYGAFGVAGNYNNGRTSNSATNNPPNNFRNAVEKSSPRQLFVQASAWAISTRRTRRFSTNQCKAALGVGAAGVSVGASEAMCNLCLE